MSNDKKKFCSGKKKILSYPIGDYKIIRRHTLNKFTDDFNPAFLSNTLKTYGRNISKTTYTIDIPRHYLHEMINKYEL